MDATTLKNRFPELKTIGDPTLDPCIVAAEKELDEAILGEAYEEAWALLAAHKVAVSPYGRAARLLTEKGESTYNTQFKELIQRTVLPLTVVGGLGPVPCP